MEKEVLKEIFKELDALSPEELRMEILKGKEGNFSEMLLDAKFFDIDNQDKE